jgi:formate hydrogenlyase subunit 3/multisubunit Na+/H+ antiporter MnhD subunit
MAAPVLFIAFPMLAASVVYLVRRVPGAAAALAVLVCVLLAVLALGLPLGQPAAWLGGATVESSFTVLGRVFEIEPGDRLALAFIFAQSALIFLVSANGETNEVFLAAGLAMTGLLAAALFVRPFLFAAVFVQLASALAVLMLAGPGRAAGAAGYRGALRLLAFTTLGAPFILLTGWLLEANARAIETAGASSQAVLLLMVGFAILLGVVPFHSWLPAVAEHASPFAAAFVFTAPRQTLVFLLLAFLNAYPWLGANPVVFRALTLAGGGMVLVGALFAFGQRNFGRLMGYVMLADIGAVMLAVGLETRAGVELALAGLALRGLALPLWALGVDQMRSQAGSDHFDALSGFGRRNPLAAAAAVVGALSIVGFPLTVGFVGRWALLHGLAQIHPSAAILLLAALASVSLVCARGLSALLGRGAPQPESEPAPASRLGIALYGLGFACIFALGFFPQWLIPAVARTAAVFTALAR